MISDLFGWLDIPIWGKNVTPRDPKKRGDLDVFRLTLRSTHGLMDHGLGAQQK